MKGTSEKDNKHEEMKNFNRDMETKESSEVQKNCFAKKPKKDIKHIGIRPTHQTHWNNVPF